MKDEYKVVCYLSNGDIADLWCQKTIFPRLFDGTQKFSPEKNSFSIGRAMSKRPLNVIVAQ